MCSGLLYSSVTRVIQLKPGSNCSNSWWLGFALGSRVGATTPAKLVELERRSGSIDDRQFLCGYHGVTTSSALRYGPDQHVVELVPASVAVIQSCGQHVMMSSSLPLVASDRSQSELEQTGSLTVVVPGYGFASIQQSCVKLLKKVSAFEGVRSIRLAGEFRSLWPSAKDPQCHRVAATIQPMVYEIGLDLSSEHSRHFLRHDTCSGLKRLTVSGLSGIEVLCEWLRDHPHQLNYLGVSATEALSVSRLLTTAPLNMQELFVDCSGLTRNDDVLDYEMWSRVMAKNQRIEILALMCDSHRRPERYEKWEQDWKDVLVRVGILSASKVALMSCILLEIEGMGRGSAALLDIMTFVFEYAEVVYARQAEMYWETLR